MSRLGKHLQTGYQRLAVILFVIAIFLPAIKMLTSPIAQWSSTEKRKLADLPALPSTPLQINSYFSKLENYLRDHFGYRDAMIHRYYRELEKRFGQTGFASKVIKGQDGWYYLTMFKELEDYMGKIPLPTEQLEQWRITHLEREDWLKKKRLRYLLIIPPNKSSIYPEHLPEDIIPLKGTSRYEQLLEYIKNRPVPALIDLRQPLLEAKTSGQLYYRADTHWNMRGALVAFQSIAARLQRNFPGTDFFYGFRLSEDIPRPCRETPFSCDLARMALHQDETFDTYPTLLNGNRCAHPLPIERYGLSRIINRPDAQTTATGCDRKALVAIVFSDSFCAALQPYLSENFREIIFVWEDFSRKRIEEILKTVTPDVVIDEIVERNAFNIISSK